MDTDDYVEPVTLEFDVNVEVLKKKLLKQLVLKLIIVKKQYT